MARRDPLRAYIARDFVNRRDSSTDAAAVIGHQFAHPALLREALTHRSVATETEAPNERLEFLGDRVLALVVADLLVSAFPTENEGALSKRLAALVSGQTLADVAIGLGLGRYVQMAKSETPGWGTRSILGDAMEAVIGALYLDGGLPVAREFISAHWGHLIAAAIDPPEDPKTRLQECLQAAGKPLPQYEIVQVSGPAHSPTFCAVLRVEGYAPVEATGNSKRAAEKAAAKAMLDAVVGTTG